MVSTVAEVRLRRKKVGLNEIDTEAAAAEKEMNADPQKNLQRGEEFIRERERQASQLQAQNAGLSNKQAVAQATQNINQGISASEKAQVDLIKQSNRLNVIRQEGQAQQGIAPLGESVGQAEPTTQTTATPEQRVQGLQNTLPESNVQQVTAAQANSGISPTFLGQVPEIKQTAVGIILFLKSQIRGSESKSTGVKQAEAAFADAEKIIQNEIEQVRMGLRDPIEVKKSLIMGTNAINDLEAQTHGINKYDLRYMNDQGRELETAIALQKSSMAEYLRELDQAAVEGRVAKLNMANPQSSITQ
jgi:hypothetical protein